MDKSWLVHPPRQGFSSPPSFLMEARSIGRRVGVVEVSVGSRQENSILPLSFLMLETCTFLRENATKRVRKPVLPVRFLDQRNFFVGAVNFVCNYTQNSKTKGRMKTFYP